MPAPRDTLWQLEPHSLGKHHILKRYVEAWLPIMTDGNRRVVIVDAFAGPGRYSGGEPGSPLILLEAFLGHRYRPNMRSEIVYLFIEERPDRVAHLREEIARLDVPANVRIECEPGKYEDVFRRRLHAIRGFRNELAPTFAFVDPFGYTDASMDLTGTFLQFERCEVLIYMPLSFVVRFVGREGQERAMSVLFGTGAWQQAVELHRDARREFLHDLFRDQLHTHGSRYVRSFEIHVEGGNGYHLFFGTNHRTGLLKMKEAMWSLDRLAGQRYSDSTVSDQMVLFDSEVDTTPLLRALRAHFGSNVFTIEQAEDFTLFETPFVPSSHLKRRTLLPAERAGRIQAVSVRQRSLSYPAGTRLRFVREI